MESLRLGIDLGGTKIEIAALRGDLSFVLRRRVPTPAHDYDAIVATIARLVADAEDELGSTCPVGVGTPGSASRHTGLIKNANSTVLIGKPLQHDLERALERPIRTTNDANCFALSEARGGAGSGHRNVFGAILGTGSGGGIVVDGRILDGRNGIAGEWAHNPLPWPRDDERFPRACYCGKAGCLETYVSGPGLTRTYREQTGASIHAFEIAALAQANDDVARRVLETYVDQLARGLSIVLNVIDPNVVVLGGGVSNVELLYRELPGAMAKYAFSDFVDTPVVPAVFGDSSGVRGAAMLH